MPYGDKIPLKFLASQKHAKLEQMQEKFLSFKLKGIDQQVENISLDKVGKSVQLMTQDNMEYPLICEVRNIQEISLSFPRLTLFKTVKFSHYVHLYKSSTTQM